MQPREFAVTTDSDHEFEVYLNLASRMKLTGMNQLWVADITYIRLTKEFVYLSSAPGRLGNLDGGGRSASVKGGHESRSLKGDVANSQNASSYLAQFPAGGCTSKVAQSAELSHS